MSGYFDEDGHDLRTDVELLKKDVGGLSKVVDKLDITIEKISEVATHLDRMVLMQQAHIDQQSKDDKYIMSKLGDLSERIKKIENSRWFVMGVAATGGVIISLFFDIASLIKG